MSLLSLPNIPDGAVPKEMSNGMSMNEQSRAPCSVDRCWQFEDQKMFDTKIHKEAKSHASEQDLDMAVDRAVTPRSRKTDAVSASGGWFTWQYFRKLSGNIVAEPYRVLVQIAWYQKKMQNIAKTEARGEIEYEMCFGKASARAYVLWKWIQYAVWISI